MREDCASLAVFSWDEVAMFSIFGAEGPAQSIAGCGKECCATILD